MHARALLLSNIILDLIVGMLLVRECVNQVKVIIIIIVVVVIIIIVVVIYFNYLPCRMLHPLSSLLSQ